MCRAKPSSGLHYGVKMCEADKQFLKRTFHYQIQYPPCAKEGDSVCPPRPRGWCQICRLRRCLSTPVRLNEIRIGAKTLRSSRSEQPAVPLYSIAVQPPPYHHVEVEPLRVTSYEKKEHFFNENVFKDPIPSTFRKIDQQFSNLLIDPILNSHKFEIVDNQFSEPLDLSVKKRKQRESELFDEQVEFILPTTYVQINEDEPLDLSPLSHHTDQLEATDLSRPSSTEPAPAEPQLPVSRRTASPLLDGSQVINKMSVNSAVLGDALSRIQGNISMSNSLINLSSISDILSETEK